jgi:hypothetical protein
MLVSFEVSISWELVYGSCMHGGLLEHHTGHKVEAEGLEFEAMCTLIIICGIFSCLLVWLPTDL